MNLLDLLGYAGNLVDLPGSSVRDLLSGRDPLDQWRTPFSSENRATGRDVLEPFLGANQETGMAGWLDNPMEGLRDVAGFGAEMLLDPLNLVPGGAMMKALRNRKAIKTANAAAEAANRGRYGFVNARLMADGSVPAVKEVVPEIMDVPVSPMAAGPRGLPMYPEREVIYHGGYDWSANATPEHPYGTFDFDRLRSSEGTNAYGPAAYSAEAEETSIGYWNLAKDRAKSVGDMPDPNDIRQVRERLTSIFSPGKFVPYKGADTKSKNLFKSIARNMTLNRRDNEAILEKFRDSPRAAQYADVIEQTERRLAELPPPDAKLVGVTVDYLEHSPSYLGVQMDGEAVFRTPDRRTFKYPVSQRLTDFQEELAQETLGRSIRMTRLQPRLYELDAPAGTKDRYLDWNARFDMQPEAVRQAVVQRLIGVEVAPDSDTVNAVLNAIQENQKAVEARRYIDNQVAMDKATAGGVPSFLKQQRQLAYDWLRETQKVLDDYGVDPFGMRAVTGTGEDIADYLIGGHPSQAGLEDVLPLAEMGIPGIKNLARSTGRSTYNYATWDPELLDQLRIRAIDGERVPINPTTLVTGQPRRVIPQPADSEMMEVLNPMSLKPVPGLGFPAAVGAVYNALARSNSYGGLQ